jgi:ribonuclease BN (tRNA processing enzyme)
MDVTFVGCGDAFGSGGRHQTCFHLRDQDHSWLIDCGATAYHALVATAVPLSSVSTILISHFHGDHFGGIPFVLLDGLFRTRRTTDLTLIGPSGLEARLAALMEAIFPGYMDRPRDFALHFIEIAPGVPVRHEGATIEAFLMVHDAHIGTCLGYRVTMGERVLAFSGDTAWTEALVPLAQGADLFICECHTLTTEIPVHLNHRILAQNLPRIGAKRVVLTHMSDEMLAATGDIAEECAYDGLTIRIA